MPIQGDIQVGAAVLAVCLPLPLLLLFVLLRLPRCLSLFALQLRHCYHCSCRWRLTMLFVLVTYADGDKKQYTFVELEGVLTAVPGTATASANGLQPVHEVREKRQKRGETVCLTAELAIAIVGGKADRLSLLLKGDASNSDLGELDPPLFLCLT